MRYKDVKYLIVGAGIFRFTFANYIKDDYIIIRKGIKSWGIV